MKVCLKGLLNLTFSVVLLFPLTGYSLNQDQGEENMTLFSRKASQEHTQEQKLPAQALQEDQARRKNLNGVSFAEREKIKAIISELAVAQDPYTASLPLLISAKLGSETYSQVLAQMLRLLNEHNTAPEKFPAWQRSNSFKAWMWGRVLLAADAMNDAEIVTLAKDQLTGLLNQRRSDSDQGAFFAWAWGYRAALSSSEYQACKDIMMQEARVLTQQYKSLLQDPESKPDAVHASLSNAMWAWVMNIQAAAIDGDQDIYDEIKRQIKLTAGKATVAEALQTALLRTAESNDYPGWGMATVRNAASIKGNDEELMKELEKPLADLITGAERAQAKAEYALSVLDNELVLQNEKLNREKLAVRTFSHNNAGR